MTTQIFDNPSLLLYWFPVATDLAIGLGMIAAAVMLVLYIAKPHDWESRPTCGLPRKVSS